LGWGLEDSLEPFYQGGARFDRRLALGVIVGREGLYRASFLMSCRVSQSPLFLPLGTNRLQEAPMTTDRIRLTIWVRPWVAAAFRRGAHENGVTVRGTTPARMRYSEWKRAALKTTPLLS